MDHILNIIKHILNIVVFAYISGRIWELKKKKICPGSCFRANIGPRNLLGLRMSLSNVKNGGEHNLEKGQEKGSSRRTDTKKLSLNMGLLGI